MTAETIARGLGLRRSGHTWRGACPVHGGSSFTIADKGGKPVFYCWSSCNRGAILVELRQRGLWPESDWTPAQKHDWAAQKQRDETDMRQARPFAVVAVILVQECLKSMKPWDSERAPLTRLLAALRTEAGALAEYRAWRARDPCTTAALGATGRRHRRRLERLLADYLEVRNAA